MTSGTVTTIKSAILSLFAVISTTNAQTMDVFGGIGYGFGIGGKLISSTTLSVTTPTNREDFYLNYGKGLKMELGAGYYIMENVQAQFSLNFNAGIPSIEEKFSSTTLPSASITTYNYSSFGAKFIVAPRFKALELLDMYTGVGLGLFFGNLKYEQTQGASSEVGHYESSPSIAFLGKVGADYPLTDLFSLYGEINFEEMTFVWTKQIIDKTSFSGVQPGSYPFEKDVPNLPAPEKISGSNWQIKAGVRFLLY